MTNDMRRRADDQLALDWLKRCLEWEEILNALRATARGDVPLPDDGQQEPAAA
jgi:hypothetical protein